MTKAEQWHKELKELTESGALEATEKDGFVMYRINSPKFPEGENFWEFLGDLIKIKGNTL